MKIKTSREEILGPLQHVIGAVERRQTIPALSNVFLNITGNLLSITGTDLEIELISSTSCNADQNIELTLPARKLFDICKNLPEGAELIFTMAPGKVTLTCGRSRFVLATLPAEEFPRLEGVELISKMIIPQTGLRSVIEKTSFAMAQQDVRYYLNGLMLEISNKKFRAVATDGHRLSLSEMDLDIELSEMKQVIIPRKGIVEVQKLLADTDEPVELGLSNNHIRAVIGSLCFTSKLIDGRFPDYERVIPSDCDREVFVDRTLFKQALTRTSILSNEKYKGVRLTVEGDTMRIQTQNPEQEEAEEELSIEYGGESIEIGFNVTYVLDVLNILNSDKVKLSLKDSNSSCLITDPDSTTSQYVIMPMRL